MIELDDFQSNDYDDATRIKIREVKKLITHFFPGIRTSMIIRGNTDRLTEIIKGTQVDFILKNENAEFQATSYFYRGTQLVHFTSFEKAIKILGSKTLRLYNLRNLNDPREFTFASQLSTDNKDLFKDAKDNMFLMSFCDGNILKKAQSKDEFNMWRLYGDNGKGVALVFSIANDPLDWEDFHCSNIIYGAKNRAPIKSFFSALEELNKQVPYITSDLSKLHIFHKSRLYMPEKEVRLVFDCREKRNFGGRRLSRNDIQTFPIIKSDEHSSSIANNSVRYLELPIYTNEFVPIDDFIPIFKIEEIQIGYNYQSELQSKITELQEHCTTNIGYEPIIRQTMLSKMYWEAL